jgi:CreA protein
VSIFGNNNMTKLRLLLLLLSFQSGGSFNIGDRPVVNAPPKQAAFGSRPATIAGGAALSLLTAASVFFSAPLPALADGSRVVGNIQGSGLVFKDTLTVEAFPDPKVEGVNLYISNFQIPMTERLSKGKFFSDPSYASVACARGKTIRVADNIARGPGGEEVFEESKSILFKTLRVQRIYDEQTNTVVYAAFNTRLDKNDDDNKSRFKSSVCAVNLD